MFITISETDLDLAIDKAFDVQDVRGSAKLFEKEITTVMRIVEHKQRLSQAKWTGRVAKFCSKLYPLAKISIQLAGAVGEVCLRFGSLGLTVDYKLCAIERYSGWIGNYLTSLYRKGFD